MSAELWVKEPQVADSVGWDEDDWEDLLQAIRHELCTPFLGAGACEGVLPLGGDIAREWAKAYDFPFPDEIDLSRVAQFLAIKRGPNKPRLMIREKFSGKVPDFTNPFEIHRLMADLALPVYITTNYDDFMFQALSQTSCRKPRQEVCRWYLVRQNGTPGTRHRHRNGGNSGVKALEPTSAEPIVFHLHGRLEDINSMVLTVDDYLDFLMSISEVRELIPPRIERAFVESSLLFLGYSLEDMNFRVIFRKLASYLARSEGDRHVSVQLAPTGGNGVPDKVQLRRVRKQQDYLVKQFGLQRVKIYWGSCAEFAKGLRQRWEKRRDKA